MIIDLLNDIKEIRNDMVAKNYPYKQLTNLNNWAKFEEENPNTFRGMYQFWSSKFN